MRELHESVYRCAAVIHANIVSNKASVNNQKLRQSSSANSKSVGPTNSGYTWSATHVLLSFVFLCFVAPRLGRVRISILQCNQCTMFIRKNKIIIIIILQAVDGATVVAMGHRCSNRSQHFLSLSTGRWCHRYGNYISSRARGRSVACWTFTGRVFHPAQLRPLNGHPPSIYTIICLKSVAVRKLQVAILVRSPRDMSQTDRIV